MPTFIDTIRAAAARLFSRTPAPAPSSALSTRASSLDHGAVGEPSSRTWIEWTPDLITAAEIQADGGALRLAADLCHALMGDDRVIATLGVRTRGLMGLPVTFDPGSDRRKIKRVLRAIEADEDWWAMADEAALAELLLWGVLLGVGFAKLVPVQASSGRDVLRLEVWDPRHFRWDAQARTWMVATDAGVEVPVAADGRWVIFAPYGSHAPWRRGIWRALARWWLLKSYARSDWQRHSEVKAAGVIVVTQEAAQGPAPGDLSTTQRTRLATQIATMGRDAAMVLPRGFDAKLIEAAANNFQTFESQTNAANSGIAIAALGQNLTTEVTGGSYAAAQVHKQVADYLRRGDAEALSTTLHDQVLVFWAAHNFGDPSVAPWPRWRVDPEADITALGAAYRALGEGLAALSAQVPEGMVIDRLALFERAGIPLMTAPEPAALPAPSLPVAIAALREDGWTLAMVDGLLSAEVDGETFSVPLAAAGVTNFPAEGGDEAVSLRNSAYDRVPIDYALALRDDHPDVWSKGGNVLGTRQFSRLLPVVRRGGKPETATEELAVRLREAWCARHAKAGTGATVAGAVAAVKWWSFLNRPQQIRRVLDDATSKDTR